MFFVYGWRYEPKTDEKNCPMRKIVKGMAYITNDFGNFGYVHLSRNNQGPCSFFARLLHYTNLTL